MGELLEVNLPTLLNWLVDRLRYEMTGTLVNKLFRITFRNVVPGEVNRDLFERSIRELRYGTGRFIILQRLRIATSNWNGVRNISTHMHRFKRFIRTLAVELAL